MNFLSILDNTLSNRNKTSIIPKTIYMDNLSNIENIISKSIYYAHNDYSIICKYRNLSIKVILYEKNCDSYTNGEIDILLILSNLVIENKTPHIIIPLIYSFINIDIDNLYHLSLSKLKPIYNDYLNNKIDDTGLIIISEWYKYNDLRNFVRKTTIGYDEWCIILFKIMYTLTIIYQQYPSFRHNDLSFKNILVGSDIDTGYDLYYYNNIYYKIPNYGFQIYLWDFEYSNIVNIVDNIDIAHNMINDYGIRKNKNQYYDLHFLLNSTYFNIKPPFYIKEFIERVLPNNHISINNDIIKEYRLIADIEYTTPKEVLNDMLFKQFIIDKPIDINSFRKVYNIS